MPNKDLLAQYLGRPLTAVPDPFSNEYPSFGAANNARLRAFLDHFGFDYEFASSTDYYKSGRFDATLLKMLAAYDKIMADGAELFRGVAADEAVDLQQLLVGEAEIGLADRHQLVAALAFGPDAKRVIGVIG